MWPILLCSVIGLAVLLERSWFFLRLWSWGRGLEVALAPAWRAGDLAAVRKAVRGNRHPVAQVVQEALAVADRPADIRNELIRKAGSQQLEKVEQRLKILAAISHLSPLIGLLGTVLGMVLAFAQIEALAGSVKPADLAGGIWEALLTTVFGLAVAIPCMAAYHGFEAVADRLARQMQFASIEMESMLHPEGSAGRPIDEGSPTPSAEWNAVES